MLQAQKKSQCKEPSLNKCHFKETKFHNSGKTGHIKKAWCSKTQTEIAQTTPGRGQQPKHTKYVEADKDTELEVFVILIVTSKDS